MALTRAPEGVMRNAFHLISDKGPKPREPEHRKACHPVAGVALDAGVVGGIQNGQDIVVQYSVNDDMPVLNTVVATVQQAGGGAVAATHTLDFNRRTGYDASSLGTLDEQNPDNDPYMNPLPFTDSTSIYETQLIVPTEWVGAYLDAGYELEVAFTDIWGQTATYTTALTAIPEPRLAAPLAGLLALLLAWIRRRRPE